MGRTMSASFLAEIDLAVINSRSLLSSTPAHSCHNQTLGGGRGRRGLGLGHISLQGSYKKFCTYIRLNYSAAFGAEGHSIFGSTAPAPSRGMSPAPWQVGQTR